MTKEELYSELRAIFTDEFTYIHEEQTKENYEWWAGRYQGTKDLWYRVRKVFGKIEDKQKERK